MKKVLIAVCFLGLAVSVNASTTPLLVEAYQEGSITIQPNQWDTVTVVELTFSVDSTCYVQFASGGVLYIGNMWLELDGEKLPPILRGSGVYTFPNITYTYPISPGEHTVAFILEGGIDDDWMTQLNESYLQALIFLPDETGAIAERPAGDADATGAMTSVISRGPYVTVTGATELVDASGRVIEGAIEEDRVSISNLSQGTYFAWDGERTVVKIVKVE